MTVDNVTVPSQQIPLVNPDVLKAQQRISDAVTRSAAAAEAMAQVGVGGRESKFVEILKACIVGRVATDVEGFLTFARELCDGIDREFPIPDSPVPPPQSTSAN